MHDRRQLPRPPDRDAVHRDVAIASLLIAAGAGLTALPWLGVHAASGLAALGVATAAVCVARARGSERTSIARPVPGPSLPGPSTPSPSPSPTLVPGHACST